MERRQYKRFNTSGKVAAYILNSKGQPSKIPVYGVLEDVSQGGLSFTIRQSKKETARKFLGRQALLNIHPDENGCRAAKNGRITSVYNQLFNNYLINFKFRKPLLPGKVMELVVEGATD